MGASSIGVDLRLKLVNTLAMLAAPTILVVAGCGGRVSASNLSGSTASLAIHAAAAHIDTNGSTRYFATLADGKPAKVEWSVSGGDPSAGPGKISASGVYTPPRYLTEDAVQVSVNAVLAGKNDDFGSSSGTADLTVTPGFLQPLTPGNLTVGPGGSITISGSMTEVGGGAGIRFALASGSGAGPIEEVTSGAAGSLSAPSCTRGAVAGPNPAYTVCTVTYTAPAAISSAASYYVVAAVSGDGLKAGLSSSALSWTRILLNPAGISSNPAAHQAHLSAPVQLGSSSGNNSDYDSARGQLSDCCGGTLGALLQDTAGNQFVLSNNHVLARSDQSIPGETVIQPGLIDNGCTPYGVGPGTTHVATLTGYPALALPTTNVDAAIARVTAGAVDPKGNILELGSRQTDGTLSAAPPGVSSTGGKGEAAYLGMNVAKSGRTTGLTCAAVSAVDVDVVVDYFSDCAETAHAMSKTFSNQIAIAGTSFSDAGDSGALVVDSSNAEPVGLFFAGGTDANGVEHAIANPVSDVLAALDSQVSNSSGPANYSFVGGQDHPVSCLNYGSSSSLPSANDMSKADVLSAPERERAEALLPLAQSLLNPAAGIVRVGVAASKDHPGQAAIAFYVEANGIAIPANVGGIPTILLSASSNPSGVEPSLSAVIAQPRAASFNQVLTAKQKNSIALLRSNPAIFGVGVGQSFDNPNDAAIVLFVDRHKVAGNLPASIDGQRVRILSMDRLHVTRAHGTPSRAAQWLPGRCSFTQRTGATPGCRSLSEFLQSANSAASAVTKLHKYLRRLKRSRLRPESRQAAFLGGSALTALEELEGAASFD